MEISMLDQAAHMCYTISTTIYARTSVPFINYYFKSSFCFQTYYFSLQNKHENRSWLQIMHSFFTVCHNLAADVPAAVTEGFMTMSYRPSVLLQCYNQGCSCQFEMVYWFRTYPNTYGMQLFVFLLPFCSSFTDNNNGILWQCCRFYISRKF